MFISLSEEETIVVSWKKFSQKPKTWDWVIWLVSHLVAQGVQLCNSMSCASGGSLTFLWLTCKRLKTVPGKFESGLPCNILAETVQLAQGNTRIFSFFRWSHSYHREILECNSGMRPMHTGLSLWTQGEHVIWRLKLKIDARRGSRTIHSGTHIWYPYAYWTCRF